MVDDLLAGLDRLEAAAWQARQQQARQQQARTQQEAAEVRQQREVLEALEALGLPWGATCDAVKAAHRRLVKHHHPDMGGDAEAFRRINAAYQWLTA